MSALHLKPPAEFTNPDAKSYAPPPVISAAPVGKPETLGLLKPKAPFAGEPAVPVSVNTNNVSISSPAAVR